MKNKVPVLIEPVETGKALAERVRTLRLARRWTRDTLAMRAGISAASLKRFETTGKSSLELVLKTAHALSRLHEFNELFAPPAARSIVELEERAALRVRKRGRI